LSTTEEPVYVVRKCDKCGAEDSEPHHVQYVALSHPVTGQGTDLSVSKHVQCCAEDGCEICSADVERAAQEGADPSRLREFLQNRPADHQDLLQEKFGVATAQEESDGEPRSD
jgi:hypothetical protein